MVEHRKSGPVRVWPMVMVLSGLAMACVAASPARADDHDRGNGRYNGQVDNRGRNQQRQHAWQQERWREQHRYDQYERRPDVYYRAPPAVYAPRPYYRQQPYDRRPGASLNFGSPFYR